jgi:lipopolysaccharide export system permease protein
MLKSELRAINPLLLLRNKHLVKIKGMFFEALGPSTLGEFASDAILAMPNKNSDRLNLILAKNLKATKEAFIGKQVTMISSLSEKDQGGHDPLIIENIETSTTPLGDFAPLLQKKVWTVNNDFLGLNLLLARLKESQDKRTIDRALADIFRRGSIALAAFTFTLMGASYGMSIGRLRSNKGIFVVVALAALYISCFFAAQGMDNLRLAAFLYFAPHFFILGLSVWHLRRFEHGIE